MFRLIFMTFYGESRVDSDKEHHIHESPAVMTIPLIVLAVLATVGGWVGLPDGLLWGNAFVRFLAPAVGTFKPALRGELDSICLSSHQPLRSSESCSRTCSTSDLPGMPFLLAWRLKAAYDLLLNKYYIDELYNLVVTRPLFWISNNVLNRAIDHTRSTAPPRAPDSPFRLAARWRGALRPATSSTTHSFICSARWGSWPITCSW